MSARVEKGTYTAETAVIWLRDQFRRDAETAKRKIEEYEWIAKTAGEMSDENKAALVDALNRLDDPNSVRVRTIERLYRRFASADRFLLEFDIEAAAEHRRSAIRNRQQLNSVDEIEMTDSGFHHFVSLCERFTALESFGLHLMKEAAACTRKLEWSEILAKEDIIRFIEMVNLQLEYLAGHIDEQEDDLDKVLSLSLDELYNLANQEEQIAKCEPAHPAA